MAILLASVGLAGAQVTPPSSSPPTNPSTTVVLTTMAPTTTMYIAPSTTRAPVVTTRAAVVTTAVPRTVASTAAISTSAQPTTTVAPPTTFVAAAPATSAPALLVAGPNDTTPASGTASTGLSSGTKLKLVIAGLIAVALAIGALTFAYWRHTRPYVWEQYEEPIEDDGTTGEPTQVVPTPNLAAVTAAGAGGAAGGAEGAAPNGAPTNGSSTTGSASPPPSSSSGPVVPSLIPADVLAPQLAIVTLEDLEQTGADTKSGAAPSADAVGPPTAPMGPIDSDEPHGTGPVADGS